MDKNVDINNTPRVVHLKLWDNKYSMFFTKPEVIDKFDLMKSVRYTQMKFYNIKKKNVNYNVLD